MRSFSNARSSSPVSVSFNPSIIVSPPSKTTMSVFFAGFARGKICDAGFLRGCCGICFAFQGERPQTGRTETGNRRYNRRGRERGVAQPGSAPALGAGGRWFESSRPDHFPRFRTRVTPAMASQPTPCIQHHPFRSQFAHRVACDRFKVVGDLRRTSTTSIAQLAFFGLRHAYCEANDLDISPEPDAGVGPMDFKISKAMSIEPQSK